MPAFKTNEQYTRNSTGRAVIEEYKITGESSLFAAYNATGLPLFGAQHPLDQFLTVQNVNVDRDPESTNDNQLYVATITYDSRPGATRSTAQGSEIGCVISTGLQSSRVQQDLKGNQVGDPTVYKSGGPNPFQTPIVGLDGGPLQNPAAEVGFDVLTPTFEFEIELPADRPISPGFVQTMQAVSGTVNADGVQIRTGLNGPLQFDKGTVLFLGLRGQWRNDTNVTSGDRSQAWNMSLAFAAGANSVRGSAENGGTLPVVYADGTSAAGLIVDGKLPIRYGYWTRYTTDNDEAGGNIISGQIVVFEAYKATNFLTAFAGLM